MEHNIFKNHPLPEEGPGITSKFATIASFPIPLISLFVLFNIFPNSIKTVDDTAALNQLVTIIIKLCYIYGNSLALEECRVNTEGKKSLRNLAVGFWR